MGLRKAINDKCKDCIYDEEWRGTWRQQVEACTVTKCPLYPVRPKSNPNPVRPKSNPNPVRPKSNPKKQAQP